MNLNQLFYFRALARLEHYTKAADELQISQPTLSKAITLLESELKVDLFQKQGRNVVLTKNGEIYLGYVEDALGKLEAGKFEMERLSRKGIIKLAFISTVGSFFIPKLISDFLRDRHFKDFSFSCNEGNTDDLLKGLKNELYDIVICSKRDHEAGFEFIPIFEQRIVMLVPDAHPLANRKSVRIEDAAAFPFILQTPKSGIRLITNNMFARAGIDPIIAYEVEGARTIAGLVEANLGIALVSESPEIENFNVRILPIDDSTYKRYIYLVTVKCRSLSPPAQEFKTYIQKAHSRDR